MAAPVIEQAREEFVRTPSELRQFFGEGFETLRPARLHALEVGGCVFDEMTILNI